MALKDGSTLESSLTQPIIQRSMYLSGLALRPLTGLMLYRALMATIKNNGNCPCPRCKVRKQDISKLGMKSDMASRRSETYKTGIRKDDLHYRAIISSSRKVVYENDYGVDSKAIDRILKAESLVPTSVSSSLAILRLPAS